MSSAAVGTHSSGAGPLSLMSCVRESSPPQDFYSDGEKCVASKRRFWNPKRWFRRKAKVSGDAVAAPADGQEIGKDALRSRSTSELSVTDEGRRRSSSSMHPGLSVSHDSVFHSPHSGSDMELDAAQSSSSLSISQPLIDLRLQSELSERLRLRRSRGDTSEDDEGLPRSPCNSPTASDGLLRHKTAIKDLPTKSHSTCSDGSLLSMESYEDEDSFGPQSRHSSKLSLHEKKTTSDSSFEFESSSVPLNHSAAHHRASIKPKRTHAPSRRKKSQQLSIALPATPEVNEDSSIRSLSPEISRKETLTELYSMNAARTVTDSRIKCSSLPPGLSAPGAESGTLNRSKSNAGSKSQDHFAPLRVEEKQGKLSLLDRIFPRRSGRKKKRDKVEEVGDIQSETRGDTEEGGRETTDSGKAESHTHPELARPVPAPRTGPASRQRVLPMDIPQTSDEARIDAKPPLSPEKPLAGTSPLQVELENRFKQRQISLSTSPTAAPDSPPLSPKSPRSPRVPRIPDAQILPTVISSSSEHTYFSKSTSITTRHADTRSRSEDFKSRIKMPGLSSLQQRALTLNEDPDSNFKSLTDFAAPRTSKPLAKSHSFKETKKNFASARASDVTADFLSTERSEENRNKAASLDSVKHLEDEVHYSELKLELKKPKPDVRVKTESKESVFDNLSDSLVTISGPSHAAIVNITSNKESFASSSAKAIETAVVDGSHTISIKESQVSVTKIQMEQTQIETTVSVDKPLTVSIGNPISQSTVSVDKSLKQSTVLVNKPITQSTVTIDKSLTQSTNKSLTLGTVSIDKSLTHSTGSVDKPVTQSSVSVNMPLSQSIVSVDKSLTLSTNKPPHQNTVPVDKPLRPTSNIVLSVKAEGPVGLKPLLSFDHDSEPSVPRKFSKDNLEIEIVERESDKSSQDSLEELGEKPVALRRKSTKNKKDEEPELMKVFARRSLKLKDDDLEALQDSLRDSDKENQDLPMVENGSPVLLRRTFNQNIFIGQRAISVTEPKSELIVRKQSTFSADHWMTNLKNEAEEEVKDRELGELIGDVSGKDGFITQPKNFSQRKAEWEQRAQQAQKKTAH